MNAATAEMNGIDITKASDVKPHREKILVKPVPLDQERLTPGGLIIPDTQLEFHDKPRWGTVIAVGPEVTEVSPGENVLITEGCGWITKFFDDKTGDLDEYMFVVAEHLICTMELEEGDFLP